MEVGIMVKPTNEEITAVAANLTKDIDNTQEQNLSAASDRPNCEQSMTPKSLIGKCVKVKGNIAAKEDLLIDGHVEGTLVLKHNKLEIGEDAHIEANAIAKVIIIGGEFKGDIYAENQVIVTKTGRVIGNIYAGDVTVEDGATIKGSIDMEKQNISEQPVFPDLHEDHHTKSATFGLLFKRMREIAHLDTTTPYQHNQDDDATLITKHASDELMVLKVDNNAYQEHRFDGKSVIGEAVMITGELITEEDVVVQGQIDGSVYFKNCDLVVGSNAQIQANIFVKSIVTHGEIKGDVYANEHVHIKKPGHVFGNIHSPRVSIESGAVLMGKIEMEPQDIDKAYSEKSAAKNVTEVKSKYTRNNEHVGFGSSLSDISQDKDSQWTTY